MAGYFVYVLRSEKDGKRYIGFTSNLERRINEHNSRLVKSTRFRRPLVLVYYEEFSEKSEAMKREKFFKSGRGREFLNDKTG
jgi:putative endonuclease